MPSRGPNGLGLELDATNTIINIIKGAADVQGHFKLGDTIASVDGIPLRGRLLQEAMDLKKSSYSFDVWRLARVAPDPPKSKEPLRRAISSTRAARPAEVSRSGAAGCAARVSESCVLS